MRRIKHLVVCINKMDLVEFRQEDFERVREQFMAYAERLDAADIQFIPISALQGDNVVDKSSRMPWFEGPPLLYTLENVYVRNDANYIDARFPIQMVISAPDSALPNYRGLAGQVASGVFKSGDEIVHLPTGLTAIIAALHGPSGRVESAFYPMSIVMELDRHLDIKRGDLLARPNNQPQVGQDIEVMLCWLAEIPYDPARHYILRHTTRESPCLLREVRYKLDITTLHRNQDQAPLAMNDLARVSLRTDTPLFYDSYKKNRQTGAIILMDESDNTTVAAGMLL